MKEKINAVKVNDDCYDLYYENGTSMACSFQRDAVSAEWFFISRGGEVGYTFREIDAIFKKMYSLVRRSIEAEIRAEKIIPK